MITHRAGIPILALTFGQIRVLAPGLTKTCIRCTFVSIIAEVNIAAVHVVRLVNFTVAIIVQTIAGFRRGHASIARGQSFVSANPLPHAQSEFVINLARRPETQFHRLLRARANPRIGHALQCVDPIDSDCRQT
jgi:hypothetical protein